MRTYPLLALLLAGLACTPTTAAPPERTIAVTVDDLPLNPPSLPVAEQERLTERLLAAFREHGVPATGFVNEGKLEAGGEVDPRRVALLERWLDAGHELGNHTFTHVDLHRVPLADYQAEVLAGERVTRKLLAERERRPRFFRHPYLHTGRSLPVKRGLEAFLAEHGYRVAPVTHDNSEWIFAAAYERAVAAGDDGLARKIGDAYAPYMMAKLEFFEGNARDLFGREIPQVLLLHANRLNADRFGELAAALAGRGYRFVTLEQALEDPAFESPDTYTGPAGLTWLHRWALTRGVEKSFFAGEPEAPGFVLEAAGVEGE